MNERMLTRNRLTAGRLPRSLKSKLLIGVIPPVVLVLLATGYLTHTVSRSYINTALERNAHVQTMAVAHEINALFERCRRDLRFVAQGKTDRSSMRDFLLRNIDAGGIPYRELAFISQKDDGHCYFVARSGRIVEIPVRDIAGIRPNPLLYYEEIRALSKDEVHLSPITEVEHPFPSDENPNQRLSSKVIYFAIRSRSENASDPGYLLLSIDVRQVRDILSLFNSPKSPLWAYPRTSELRYSFVFDKDGWMLFQSGDPDKPDAALATDIARAGYSGTLGRPGMPNAFRPSSASGNFWKMIGDIREGKNGLFRGTEGLPLYGETKDFFQAYAPILFRPGPALAPVIYGGVTYIDRSRLTTAAGYKHIDVMFVITLSTVAIVVAVIFLLSRWIMRPIFRLTRSVDAARNGNKLEPIDIPLSDYETLSLKEAINNMILKMREQIEAIQFRDMKIEQATLKEKAPLEETVSALLKESLGSEIPEIVGYGAKIEKLKSSILKSAGVDVDVLIMGETGTGKQLTAEAIHNHSRRSGKPFISINCGELDENLLMDTLFGHLKGAYTEARTDRKGAFLEANGGTLFLDEIQTASLTVQQALLRALAARKIKPLGSDREIDVDVRVIAATNVDLSNMIDHGAFRQDLYFRLKVITIQTPTLREQKENIPILTVHYLKQAELLARKSGLGLSRGALEKIKAYDWPGNVRELMNVITRAVVMAEGKIIHEDEVVLESDQSVCLVSSGNTAPSDRNGAHEDAEAARSEATPSTPRTPTQNCGEALNPRQLKAWDALIREREITRNRYQEIIGGNISPRTAIYDLKDMVKKGLLKKTGRGPATRYIAMFGEDPNRKSPRSGTDSPQSK